MPPYKISVSWTYDPVAKTIQKDGDTVSTDLDPSSPSHVPGDAYARKVDVYEDRVRSWFLDFARSLDGDHNAGFVVLMLCCSYLEGVEQFRSGVNSSGISQALFIRSAARVLSPTSQGPNPEDWSLVYQAARCGLFHVGMTPGSLDWKPRILNPANQDEAITPNGMLKTDKVPAWLLVDNNAPYSAAFSSDSNGVRTALLSPRQMQNAIQADFNAYIADLRNPGHSLRTTFDQRFVWP